jgi:hypothetical protein
VSRQRDNQRAESFFAALGAILGSSSHDYESTDALILALTSEYKLPAWLKAKLGTAILRRVLNSAPLRDAVLFELREEQREASQRDYWIAYKLREPKSAAGFDTPNVFHKWPTAAQVNSQRYRR